MVQEFHVLRCFSCQTFQVHQVKKSKKWNCKMCGEKQSLVKVFGRGSGADCRLHVQKLNSLRGELQEAEHARDPEGEEEELQDEGDEALTCENELVQTGPVPPRLELGAAGAVSRWSKFLSLSGEEAGPEEGEGPEENVYTERRAYGSSRRGHARNSGKRKRSWRFSTPPGESACPENSWADQSAVKDPWSPANRRTQCERQRDAHSGSWAASTISHDASVTGRPPPAAEAAPPPGACRVEPEVRSSKWGRFLSVRRDYDDDDEEEAPQRVSWAGTSKGRTGSEEPPGLPSVPSPVCTGRFEEHGHFEEVQEEVRLTDSVFVGYTENSPESEIVSLKFSPGYQCIQKVANPRDGLSHLNSGLSAKPAPVRPQNLSISKPHPSLHSLFQTDEDFDETL
ncbi:hypothetical protein COCON_G00054400 [Conger conger]|uniref:MRN complex-interacting protein N-terminal domain-containing protein n=1 Tax=Conger conger TaxID=82655 RepID=A0A9Q1DW50_CONCO|nr:hypothetical protein COCON_G00054400 [Conger conger]